MLIMIQDDICAELENQSSPDQNEEIKITNLSAIKNPDIPSALVDYQDLEEHMVYQSMLEQLGEDEPNLFWPLGKGNDQKAYQGKKAHSQPEDSKGESSYRSSDSRLPSYQRSQDQGEGSDSIGNHEDSLIITEMWDNSFGKFTTLNENIYDTLFWEGNKLFLHLAHFLNIPNENNFNGEKIPSLQRDFLGVLIKNKAKFQQAESLMTTLGILRQASNKLMDFSQRNYIIKAIKVLIQKELKVLELSMAYLEWRQTSLEILYEFEMLFINAKGNEQGDFKVEQVLEFLKSTMKYGLINNWAVIERYFEELNSISEYESSSEQYSRKKFSRLNIICADLEVYHLKNTFPASTKAQLKEEKKFFTRSNSLKFKKHQFLRIKEEVVLESEQEKINTCASSAPLYDKNVLAYQTSQAFTKQLITTNNHLFAKCRGGCVLKGNKFHSELALYSYLSESYQPLIKILCSQIPLQYSKKFSPLTSKFLFKIPMFSTKDTCLSCDFTLSQSWKKLLTKMIQDKKVIKYFSQQRITIDHIAENFSKAMTFSFLKSRIAFRDWEVCENKKPSKYFSCERRNPGQFFDPKFLIKIVSKSRHEELDAAILYIEQLANELLKSSFSSQIERYKSTNSNKHIYQKKGEKVKQFQEIQESIRKMFDDNSMKIMIRTNLLYTSPPRTFFITKGDSFPNVERLSELCRAASQHINSMNERRRIRASNTIKFAFLLSKLRKLELLLKKIRLEEDYLLFFYIDQFYSYSKEEDKQDQKKFTQLLTTMLNRVVKPTSYFSHERVKDHRVISKLREYVITDRAKMFKEYLALHCRVFNMMMKVAWNARQSNKRPRILQKKVQVKEILHQFYRVRAQRVYFAITGCTLNIEEISVKLICQIEEFISSKLKIDQKV